MRRRLIWLLLLVTTAAYAGVVGWALTTDGGPSSPIEILWVFFFVPIPIAIGAYVMWKRPENPIGELLTVSSIFTYSVLATLELPTVSVFQRSGSADWMWATIWCAQTFTAVGLVAAIAMFTLIPDGHFRARREKRLVAVTVITVTFPTLSLISNETVQTQTISFPGVTDIASPFVVSALLPYGEALTGLIYVGYLMFLAAVVLLFMRYRSATARERKQTRWVLFGGAGAILATLLPTVLGELGFMSPVQHGTLMSILYSLPIVAIPMSIAVAVLEPPWADVDVVIRKSAVYGALSFVILLLYVGVASALGVAAGARLDVEVAVILAVLIAILFQPARRRLQTVADRWVFGKRPTRYEAVTEFGETLEQTADPSDLLPQLVDTIRKVIRFTWVTATLDDGAHAESGEVPGQPILWVPIGTNSEEIGVIRCGRKLTGSLDDDEKSLVQALAAQVGLAISNARLASRVVNAAEAERRRIERNIHDGAQQELVALVARLGMLKSEAGDGNVSPESIADLQMETRQILNDLRALAQGIHPSVLSDGGILEAVEERCSHLPIPVSLQASEGMRSLRFDDDVEGAAYFFVSEALANVLKHADATNIEVSVRSDGESIKLAVADDGCGFDPSSLGQKNGLSGLNDRISALGGTVSVSSSHKSGTNISAAIPLRGP